MTHHPTAQGVPGLASGDKAVAHYVGDCRIKIDTLTSPCDSRAMYDLSKNGDIALMFSIDQLIFILAGNSDRQPNPEDYFFIVNHFIMKNGPQKAQILETEGECHFRGNAAGDNEYSIDCTAYNRKAGFLATINFDEISQTQIDINDSAYASNAPIPPSDLTIARRAAAVVYSTLRKTGMTGLNFDIEECYNKARQNRSETQLKQCFVVDFVASAFDSAYVGMIGRPWLANPHNQPKSLNRRINTSLDSIGFDENQKEQKIRAWENIGRVAVNELNHMK